MNSPLDFRKEDAAEARDSFGASFDRRNENRFRSVCRIARVTRASDSGLWRVRNISDKGMMLVTNVALAGGEPVEIALSEDTQVGGRVVWADKGLCGVAFSEPIDVVATLTSLAEQQQAESYRALRLPVEVEAIITTNTGSQAIDLVDISQNGAGFRSSVSLEMGALVDLLLPQDELRRPALVRWARGLCGGLWFTRPIPPTELESMAKWKSATILSK